jgi:hypothetical protein
LADGPTLQWTRPINGVFTVVSGPSNLGEIKVEATTDIPQIFTDKTGSVWVWTPLGLEHWVAGTQKGQYTSAGRYVVDAAGRNPFRRAVEGPIGVTTKGIMYIAAPAGADAKGKVLKWLQLPP